MPFVDYALANGLPADTSQANLANMYEIQNQLKQIFYHDDERGFVDFFVSTMASDPVNAQMLITLRNAMSQFQRENLKNFFDTGSFIHLYNSVDHDPFFIQPLIEPMVREIKRYYDSPNAIHTRTPQEVAEAFQGQIPEIRYYDQPRPIMPPLPDI